MPHTERTNIAVFIDFDNIEIGVRTTLGEHFDVGVILEALKERGEVVTKIAYADWTRAGEYSRALTQHAIRLVQRNLTPGGDKNGADINLALDALEMAFTHTHINAYVIVGGDSDFLSLVEKLKQYDKKVFVIGGRAFTSIILQRNCHEFIAYENLVRKSSVSKSGRPMAAPLASQPVAQAFPIVRRALKILADREVTPQTGLLKSTLLQLDSTFSERTYGASSFLDFAEKLAQSGLVQLKHSGRSVTVELNASFDEGDAAAAAPAEARAQAEPSAPATASPGTASPEAAAQSQAPAPGPVVPAGDAAEGVRIVADLLRAATSARWPMYLRNFKQILRAASFDERRYSFGGLMDIVRACQRDGLLRAERDRRGGIRIFRGSALGPAAPAPIDDNIGNRALPQPQALEPSAPLIEGEALPDDVADIVDVDSSAVVDTTAELLGRAPTRRPRKRAAAAAPAPRRTTKKATAPARKTRARKATASDRDDASDD